jgi:hypothetical protein
MSLPLRLVFSGLAQDKHSSLYFVKKKCFLALNLGDEMSGDLAVLKHSNKNTKVSENYQLLATILREWGQGYYLFYGRNLLMFYK